MTGNPNAKATLNPLLVITLGADGLFALHGFAGWIRKRGEAGR